MSQQVLKCLEVYVKNSGVHNQSFSVSPLSVKVWLSGQRRCFFDVELRASAVPRAPPHSVAALERLSRDGHGGDEAGGEQHPQLLPDRSDQAQPPHPGHAPFHSVQDIPGGQSHHPWDAGETAATDGTCCGFYDQISCIRWFKMLEFCWKHTNDWMNFLLCINQGQTCLLLCLWALT